RSYGCNTLFVFFFRATAPTQIYTLSLHDALPICFACDETDELMPMPIQLAHRLTQRLSEVRKAKILDFLRPDGKSQVTIEYRNGEPARVDCVVLSTQHSEKVSNVDLRAAVMEQVIRPILPARMLDARTKYHINPTGRFVIGGPIDRKSTRLNSSHLG